jgi:hypothetical protein
MQLIEKLSREMVNRDISAECERCCWLGEDITGGEHKAAFAYLRRKGWKGGAGKAISPMALLDSALAKLVGYEVHYLYREAVLAAARQRYTYSFRSRTLLEDLTEIPEPREKFFGSNLKRDFETLRKDLERDVVGKQLRTVSEGDAVVAAYLQRRACDVFEFGDAIADLTFPLPSLPGRSREQVQEVVRWLVGKLRSADEGREDIARRGRKAQTEANIQYNCDRKYGSAQALVPATIPPRSISAGDRERLLQACINRLQAVPGVGRALSAVRELVDFCALLAMRENQLVVPGRMIAKEVPAARGSEMRHEMQRELQGLDPYVAHVSTIVKTGGQARTVKAKLRTADKPEQQDLDAQWDRWDVIKTNFRKYYAEHSRIEKEIEARRRAGETHGQEGKKVVQPEPATTGRGGVPPSSVVKEPQP